MANLGYLVEEAFSCNSLVNMRKTVGSIMGPLSPTCGKPNMRCFFFSSPQNKWYSTYWYYRIISKNVDTAWYYQIISHPSFRGDVGLDLIPAVASHRFPSLRSGPAPAFSGHQDRAQLHFRDLGTVSMGGTPIAGWFMSGIYWLVVWTPLKNISQLGWWHSQYMGK